MPQKTISLPEDVYLELKKQKKENESYPEMIKRLMKKEEKQDKNLESLAGAFADDDEWDQIIAEIYEDRKKPEHE
jgi:predicted CopG family antitoxin